MPVLDCLRLFLINAASAEAKDKVHNEQNFLPSAKSYVSCLNTVQQHCVIRGAALLLRVVFCLRFTPLSHMTSKHRQTPSSSSWFYSNTTNHWTLENPVLCLYTSGCTVLDFCQYAEIFQLVLADCRYMHAVADSFSS